jgi:hypothetical protein
LDAIGLDIPEFLDADAVGLRIDVVELFVATRSLVSEPRAFGEDVTLARSS